MVGDLGQWKSISWNFSNEWLSPDGAEFVCIFTGTHGMDSFDVIKGQLVNDEGFRADLNVDGAADARDPAISAGDWLLDAATIAIVNESALWPWADINRDAMVNLLGFRSLAEN